MVSLYTHLKNAQLYDWSAYFDIQYKRKDTEPFVYQIQTFIIFIIS